MYMYILIQQTISLLMTFHRGCNILTRWVLLVEQERLTLPEHLSSPPVFNWVRITGSLVLCVCIVDRCLSFCTFFSFGHCVVCSSLIYGFWSSLWYLQTLFIFVCSLCDFIYLFVPFCLLLIWFCAVPCGRQSTMILVSEWLLFNAKWAIFQLYHGKNSLRVNDMMMMIALDQHVYCHCAKSLKQQFVSRNIAQLESTILIPNKILFGSYSLILRV
jgi:hypothetical protein